MKKRNKSGLVATLFLAAILGTSAYAFTASNTVSAQVAGDGTAGVSGYTVSNVHFSIPDDPTAGTTVTFHLSGTASTVKASGSTDGTGLVSCSVVGAPANDDWSCDLTQTLTSADNLRVAASN
jgi:hypothetical protein